jgi:hypothetical protein
MNFLLLAILAAIACSATGANNYRKIWPKSANYD